MDFAAWNKGGSSPRMRGTLTRIASISPRTRIIPADAGNTAPAALFWTGTGDHPRGCGEHAMYRVAANESWGSSPRMRGTLGEDRQTGASLQDHPRGCGEHPLAVSGLAFVPGSSPRMRGTHRRRLQQGHPRRIIPADAGNTYRRDCLNLGNMDHPRGCGEHWETR